MNRTRTAPSRVAAVSSVAAAATFVLTSAIPAVSADSGDSTEVLLSQHLATSYGIDLKAAYDAAADDPTIDILLTGDQVEGFVLAQFEDPDRLDGLVVGVVVDDDEVHPGVDADQQLAAVRDVPVDVGEIMPCDAVAPIPQATASVFLVCDGPTSFTVGVPAPEGATLQQLLDLLGDVSPEAAELGLSTLFEEISPPRVMVDGDVATVDFDESLSMAEHSIWASTYVLEQVLTTVFVNSEVETVRLTLDGDCAAASGVLMDVPCADYDRADATNTLMGSEGTGR